MFANDLDPSMVGKRKEDPKLAGKLDEVEETGMEAARPVVDCVVNKSTTVPTRSTAKILHHARFWGFYLVLGGPFWARAFLQGNPSIRTGVIPT